MTAGLAAVVVHAKFLYAVAIGVDCYRNLTVPPPGMVTPQ